MKQNTILLLISIVFLSSCGPTSKMKTYDYDYLYITKQGIIQRPLIADLEVGKKVTLSHTYKNVTVDNARQNIIEEFIRTYNADLIVQPFFSTSLESTSSKTTVAITLTGYPANYKNIRNYDPKDKDYLLPKEFFLSPVNYPVISSASGLVPQQKGKLSKAIAGAVKL